ncbi:DUF4238 domain-containing protein [Aliivibrio fischeri]|uniref:DUF4238 domain-containing protein n=1 Tax=Aliivibrio fischeri TaxID=668 RepID=UPI0007C44DB1|nr:DUF4238 domain-containing protein [Aliivibrio fischeri]
MKNKISKNHHFIPEFYIKGFSDENEDIYLYDVEYKKIGKSAKKAPQIFYKEHLHTVISFGDKSVFIEDSYSELEGHFSKVIRGLKKLPTEALSEIAKFDLFSKIIILMMSVQYWRNPANIKHAEEMSNSLVDLYDKALLTNFKFNEEQLKGLKIIKLNETQEFICSDNPVMIDSFGADFSFQGDVFYPLTKELAITNINININNLLDIDKMIVSRASKKIIASSKERLMDLPRV